jgi:uncharacterized metal-binding protein
MMNHRGRDHESFAGPLVILTLSMIMITVVVLGPEGVMILLSALLD